MPGRARRPGSPNECMCMCEETVHACVEAWADTKDKVSVEDRACEVTDGTRRDRAWMDKESEPSG